MKTNAKILLALATLIFTASANACLPGFLKLTSVDALSAQGIYGSKGLMVTVKQMTQETAAKGQAFYRIVDNETGKQTHSVIYLGSISDSEGLMQTTYLVKDIATNTEKVTVLKSGYQGNGVTSRGLPSQNAPTADSRMNQSPDFNSLAFVGCR